jgi:uncharacterized protein YcbX
VSRVTGVVAAIAYAPVKGLGLNQVDEVELELTGVRDNRRFYLIDEDGRLVNGKVAGPLVRVRATADDDGTSLVLQLPDGSTVDGPVELGATVETNFYGRLVPGRIVGGAYGDALSELAGRALQLVRADEPGAGSDRGVEGTVSVLSAGSLEEMARQAGEERIDDRRFRMLFRIEGVEPHAEDGWAGRRVALGDAVVRLHGLVGRCLVTAQDPDTGLKSLDTLRIIRRYRSEIETDEPLPFGAWGGVEQPGRVRVGDTVEAL